MKKTKVKVLGLLLAITMVFTIIPVWAIGNNGGDINYTELQPGGIDLITWGRELIIDQFGLEFWQNYERTNTYIDMIWASFPQTRTGERVYPSYFGGFYIDDDGNLNVLLVDTVATMELSANAEYMAGLETIRGLDTGINVRYVEFSYADIWAKFHSIGAFMDDNLGSRTANNISGWYIDLINNRIGVTLVDLSYDQVAHFRSEISDSLLIVLYECQGISYHIDVPEHDFETVVSENSGLFVDDVGERNMPTSLQPSLQPGQRLYDANGEFMGSAGYRIRRFTIPTTTNAFVVSGHVVLDDQRVYNRNRVLLGIGSSRRIHYDSTILILESNVLTSNIPYGLTWVSELVPRVRNSVVGQTAVMLGGETGLPIRSGRIVYLGAALVPRGGFTIFATLATYCSAEGDSGGIVWNPGTGEVLGIHSGRREVPRTATESGGCQCGNCHGARDNWAAGFSPAGPINRANGTIWNMH